MFSESSLVNAKKIIAACFKSTADIFEFIEVTADDGTTYYKEVYMFSTPCKLSFSTTDTSRDTALVSGINLVATLFIPPSIEIKPGSKIAVTQQELTHYFENSGVPLRYFTHQEIKLRLVQEWT